MGEFASFQVTEESRAEAQAAAAPAAPSVEEISVAERPQWVPEKFYKDGKVNMKALAESYGSLEANRTKENQEKQIEQQSKEPNAKTVSDGTKPDGKDPNGNPVEGGDKAAPISIPGIAPERLSHFTEELKSGGKLSDGSFDELAKLGFPKIVVESYIKGMTADATAEQASLAAEKIAEIKSSIGGEEVLKDMLSWAGSNLTPEDMRVYNEATSSRDAAKVKMAVMGLHHAYEAANGKSPNFIGGERLPSIAGVEPFKSNAEVTQAMRDPRYDRDQGYRDQVAQRLSISDVFQGSRAVKKLEQ